VNITHFIFGCAESIFRYDYLLINETIGKFSVYFTGQFYQL